MVDGIKCSTFFIEPNPVYLVLLKIKFFFNCILNFIKINTKYFGSNIIPRKIKFKLNLLKNNTNQKHLKCLNK